MSQKLHSLLRCAGRRVSGYDKDFKHYSESTDEIRSRNQHHLTSLHQEKRFQDLDFKVQMIILKVARSPQSFDELRHLIRLESWSIKEHITHELRQQRNDMAHRNYCQEFLKSLWFAEMHRRQETVGEAHRKTFQWIFEPENFNRSGRRWDNFVQWLGEGDSIYWISGKAGSGKSTLMNYIRQDHRTAGALRAWAGTKEALVLEFFFWNAGATLEKSSEGLLRSLLFQILERFPCLTPLRNGSTSSLEHEDNGPEDFRPISAWTKSRLQLTLQMAMIRLQKTCRICMFIDGLDESGDETDRLIEVVQDMLSADVKICVSSRPDRSFQDAFGSAAHLRLQDLTLPDMRTYVHDELQPFLQKRSADEHEVSHILGKIAEKAEGVFLWVRLVVKTLSNGLRNHDSLNQLQARIESMPSDIEAMYEKMLSNIDVAHRKEAVLLFRMALSQMTGSLLDVTYVLCEEIYHVSIASGESAVLFSRQTLERIPTVGAGLLEVRLEDKDSAQAYETKYSCRPKCSSHITLPLRYACFSETTDLSYYERYARINFIHRTAVDFLWKSKEGQHFLKEHNASRFSLICAYAKGLLAKVDSLGFPEKPKNMDPEFYEMVGNPADFHAEDKFDNYVDGVARGFVWNIMNHIFPIESYYRETGLSEIGKVADVTYISLCDAVDSTLATIYQRHRVETRPVHWVTRWRPGNVSGDGRLLFTRRSTSTSPSGSSESFYSARSEPTLSLHEPIDFLGLAACCGLFRYVKTKLELQSIRLDKTYLNYLLRCSVPLAYPDGVWPHGGHPTPEKFNLTTELLNRGGNPNAYIDHPAKTLWGIHQDCWGFFNRLPSMNAEAATAKAAAVTSEAFVNAGAEVHMNRSFWPAACFDQQELMRIFGAVRNLTVIMRCEASPLYFVQRLLKTVPERKTVEDIILAKGGCIFHKHTRAQVTIDSVRIYEISEGQREELLDALNLAHDECVRRCSVDTDWDILRQKICLDNLMRIAQSRNQTSSNEDVSVDADPEGEF